MLRPRPSRRTATRSAASGSESLFDRASPDEARRILAGAVDTAGDGIVLAHAEDRAAGGPFAAAGGGVIDIGDRPARPRPVGFDGALVFYGPTPERAPNVAPGPTREIAP